MHCTYQVHCGKRHPYPKPVNQNRWEDGLVGKGASLHKPNNPRSIPEHMEKLDMVDGEHL